MSPVWPSPSWVPPPTACLLQRTSLWLQIWAINQTYKGLLGQIPGTDDTYRFQFHSLPSHTISFAMPWPLNPNHTGPFPMLHSSLFNLYLVRVTIFGESGLHLLIVPNSGLITNIIGWRLNFCSLHHWIIHSCQEDLLCALHWGITLSQKGKGLYSIDLIAQWKETPNKHTISEKGTIRA